MSQEVKDFFATYSDFVAKVTSEPSLDLEALKKSMDEIESNSSIKMPRLLTAALGLGSETGEFVEIVKKYALNGLMTESRVLCISEKVLGVLKKSGWKKLEVFQPGEELEKLKD